MSFSGPGLELRPRIDQRPELRLTQQMQIAIKLLGLSRLQMTEAVRQELIENPALEVLPEAPEAAVPEEAAGGEAPAAELYPGGRRGSRRHGEERGFEAEDLPGPGESLAEHVVAQARLAFRDERDFAVAVYLANNLNRSGYLEVTVGEAAAECGAEVVAVERVLAVMQGFDPAGVCARDLRECLLIQLGRRGKAHGTAARIVVEHLPLLARGRLADIARALDASAEEVAAAVRLIRSLEPKPGRPFFGEISRWVEPDLYARREQGRLVVRLNDRGLPRVAISREFAELAKRGPASSSQERAYRRARINAARQFVDGLAHRRQTLLTVATAILERQPDFFEKGPEHIAPLALKDLTAETGFSEATLSRATADKFVHTPHGVFGLRHFFSGALQNADGSEISTSTIRRMIREIIRGEDPRRPLSDAKICRALGASGITVARRTVAKYREQMRILPAGHRRRAAVAPTMRMDLAAGGG